MQASWICLSRGEAAPRKGRPRASMRGARLLVLFAFQLPLSCGQSSCLAFEDILLQLDCYSADPSDKPCTCTGNDDIAPLLANIGCSYGGTIPSVIGACTALTSLCVAGQVASLRTFSRSPHRPPRPSPRPHPHSSLTNNLLTGSIPPTIADLSLLTSLVISQNTSGQDAFPAPTSGLTGSIPMYIYQLTQLTELCVPARRGEPPPAGALCPLAQLTRAHALFPRVQND